jgi:hypothetical protein
LLDQGNLLTFEKLQKRGINRASRCVLCKSTAETYHRLFFDCKFSKKLWDQLYHSIHFHHTPPSNWNTMFLFWKIRYVGNFIKKPLLTSIWKEIPKFICWEIWLARNKAIFQNKFLLPSRIHSLACNLLSKTICAKTRKIRSLLDLDHTEQDWVTSIIDKRVFQHSSSIITPSIRYSGNFDSDQEFGPWKQ